MYRAMGSLAFVAAARAAWAVVRDKTDPRRRLMLAVKNNLAADTANGLAFTIEPYGPGGAPDVLGTLSRSQSRPTKRFAGTEGTRPASGRSGGRGTMAARA